MVRWMQAKVFASDYKFGSSVKDNIKVKKCPGEKWFLPCFPDEWWFL